MGTGVTGTMSTQGSTRRQFGTIRQLRSKRFQAVYRYQGAWHKAPRTFPNRKAAQAWLSTVQADIGRGAWVNPTAGTETLECYADRWLAARTDLRPTTRAKYSNLLRLHVLPALGQHPLSRLSPSLVRSWYMELRGRSQTQADDAYRVLRAIMNTAVADELLVKSPCQVRGAGIVRSAERPMASPGELAALVAEAPDRYRLSFLLMAWCSLRRGEVLALQRRDVDLAAGTVRVERSLVVPLGGAPHIGPPKTEAGTRVLAIPSNVLPAVADHLDRFTGREHDDWLFATATGTVLAPRNLQREWDKARRAVGKPTLHMHDLRGSGLTWAAVQGATTRDLMNRGGHKSPRAALIYQRLVDGRDRKVADLLAGLSGPTSAQASPGSMVAS